MSGVMWTDTVEKANYVCEGFLSGAVSHSLNATFGENGIDPDIETKGGASGRPLRI